MHNSTHYIYLLFVTLLSILINVFLLSKIEVLHGYASSGIWGIISFFLLSLLIFYRAGKLFKEEDKSSFISWVMTGTLLKMILSGIVLILYALIYKPETNYFIVPFFIYYLIFFIFETIVLMKMTKRQLL